MPEKAPPPRARRKLTRRQIQEILERNCKLYRDEESLIPYLTELALYLLEFEYDWAESGAEMPAKLAARKDEREEARLVVGAPRPVQVYRDATQTTCSMPGHDLCALCGAALNGQALCPNCKGLGN